MTPEQRFRAARWGYVAVVLLATLTQLHFSSDLTAAGERLVRAFTPSLGWRDAIDGLRNTVLFAGLGAVWVVSSRSGNVRAEVDRKSTRLNSSHVKISYAVFCLKKKKKET